MSVLPSWMFGDPANAVDRLRQARRRSEWLRLQKGKRIRALVKAAMNKRGGR